MLEQHIIILIFCACIGLSLGVVANTQKLSKEIEDKVFLAILLIGLVIIWLTGDKNMRGYIIASFGGLQIGWVSKHIWKEKK